MTDESTVEQKLIEAEKNRLFAELAPIVEGNARELARKLPACIEYDDLLQDGYLGLTMAILKGTREETGRHFRSYVSQRVRGAMLDGVRNSDPGTKHVRRSMRSVELAIHELRHDLGRSPSEEEVANALAIPLLDYQRLLQKAHGYTVLSLEDLADGGSTEEFLQACMSAQADPLAVLERRELQRRLVFAIAGLSAREREVVRLMLEENFSSRRIGEHLGLSESRISQIRTQAIANLRAAIFGSDEHPAVLKPRRRTRTVGNQG